MSDFILEMLVSMAETFQPKGADKGGMQITLAVGGMLVSGQIISSKKYFQMFGDGFIVDAIEKAKKEGRWEPAQPDEMEHASEQYIHLAEARFWLTPQQWVPNSSHGVLWRCRIDRVDGFNLGELRAGVEPSGEPPNRLDRQEMGD